MLSHCSAPQGLGADGYRGDILVAGVEATGLRVLVEQAHPGEGLAASRAAVLLVLQVGLEVGPQVGFVCKVPGAVVAGEGFLPGVGPHVTLEQPRTGEGLAALRALAGQGVRPDVHLQCGLGGVVLAAVLTRELLLDLVGAVQLLMLQEPGLRGEALLAFVALQGRFLHLDRSHHRFRDKSGEGRVPGKRRL